MRYMKGKIHFNKQELAALSKENPTLFELAERYADKAHMRVAVNDVNGLGGDGRISVYRQCVSSSGKPLEYKLACPSQVFYIPDVPVDDNYDSYHACRDMRCWTMQVDRYGKRPCWFRTWNEFVEDMHSPEVADHA